MGTDATLHSALARERTAVPAAHVHGRPTLFILVIGVGIDLNALRPGGGGRGRAGPRGDSAGTLCEVLRCGASYYATAASSESSSQHTMS